MAKAQAIKGSIQKWVDIWNGKGVDNGPRDCPLCQKYFDKCEISGILNGKGEHDICPIYGITGDTGCRHTPYDYWFNCTEHWKNQKWVIARSLANAHDLPGYANAKKAAGDMIMFLVSLLGPEDGYEGINHHNKGNNRMSDNCMQGTFLKICGHR